MTTDSTVARLPHDVMDGVLPEVIFQLRGVPLVPFVAPGTPARAESLVPFLPMHDGFLLANPGPTTVGLTLRVAHQRMESLEHVARILFTARALGGVLAQSPDDVTSFRRARDAARTRSEDDASY